MDLQIFKYSNKEVRTVLINNKPYFVAKDVAEILGYLRPNDAINQHCKGAVKHRIGVTTGKKADGSDAIQKIEMNVIPESDLYRLIMRSNLPAAEQFQDWVTVEVLPSIRKHGMYATETAIEKMLNNPDFAIKLLQEIKKEREEKQIAFQVIEKQDKFIAESKPKVDFYDTVADSKDAIDLGTAAKVLNMGIGRNKLFEILRNKNILMYNNQPYQKYIDSEYFRTIEQKWNKPDGSVQISIKTLVYQKGLDYIRKILSYPSI